MANLSINSLHPVETASEHLEENNENRRSTRYP